MSPEKVLFSKQGALGMERKERAEGVTGVVWGEWDVSRAGRGGSVWRSSLRPPCAEAQRFQRAGLRHGSPSQREEASAPVFVLGTPLWMGEHGYDRGS